MFIIGFILMSVARTVGDYNLQNSEYELLILFDKSQLQYNAYILETNCNSCSRWKNGDIKAIIFVKENNECIITWKHPKNKYGGGLDDENFKGSITKNGELIDFKETSLIKTYPNN